jgi:GH25 family lysozyme M1 (1,4-beta-N-acetylmuramidase)
MPALSASQRSFIDELYSACGNATIDIERYLSDHYFTSASGRALILQPAGGFGYFYLAPGLFEATDSRNREVSQFIGVVSVLTESAAQGLIYYLRKPDEPKGKETVHVLGERFGIPSIKAGKLILNQQGDFTDHPRTIKNSAGNDIFYGIRFEGRLFEIVNAAVRGTVHVTPGVTELSKAAIDTQPSQQASADGRQHASAITSGDTGPPAPVVMQDAPPLSQAGTAPDGANGPTVPEPSISAPEASPGAAPTRAGTGRVSKLRIVGMLGLALLVTGLLAALLYETRVIARNVDTLLGVLRAHIDSTVRQAPATPPRAPPSSSHEDGAIAVNQVPAAAAANVRLAPPAATPDSTVAFGFDISKWNSNLAEKALATPHVSFVIVRATAGMTKDFDFDVNWALVKKYAVARGAYHFYKASEDPVAQASHFLASVGKPGDMTIAPVIDFEELSFDAGSASQKVELVQARLLQALHAIEANTKRIPILYTNVNTGNKYLADPRFSRYPLWIADWTNKDTPVLPMAWKSIGFMYWQRSSSYTLPGEGNVPIDLDIYRGPAATIAPAPPTHHAGAAAPQRP